MTRVELLCRPAVGQAFILTLARSERAYALHGRDSPLGSHMAQCVGSRGMGRKHQGVNHVALAVDGGKVASMFYTEGMGVSEVFAFHWDGGWPVLSYFQINHDTFVELMLVTLTDHQVARLTA